MNNTLEKNKGLGNKGFTHNMRNRVKMMAIFGLLLSSVNSCAKQETSTIRKNAYIDYHICNKWDANANYLKFNSLNGDISKIADKTYRYEEDSKEKNDDDIIENSDKIAITVFGRDNRIIKREEYLQSDTLIYDNKGKITEKRTKYSATKHSTTYYSIIVKYYYEGDRLTHRDIYKNDRRQNWDLFYTDTFIYQPNGLLEKTTSSPMLPNDKSDMVFEYDSEGYLTKLTGKGCIEFFDQKGNIIKEESEEYGEKTTKHFSYNDKNQVVVVGAGTSKAIECEQKLEKKAFIEEFVRKCEERKTEGKYDYYAYKYDKKGNWILSVCYRSGTVLVTEREITYK